MDDPNRNIYKSNVDFATLALQDKEFAKYLKGDGQLDFMDPDAMRQLTKSLLKRDFKLDIELPEDRLCPPVPNRLNYVLWIQDLINCTPMNAEPDSKNMASKITGLDIGTGASCIYPLLACSMQPQWHIYATELDQTSAQYAQQNVDKNHLSNQITVIPVTSAQGPLIPFDKLSHNFMHFTMCNPPFYESQEELIASAAAKSQLPFSACTGSAVEMVTSGGEVAFVSRMIEESVKLQKKVQWYTSMLGKLSSAETLITKLKGVGVSNYAVTELVQGNKTRRWAIAWSWMDYRPAAQVARNLKSIPKHFLPFPSEFAFHPTSTSVSKVITAIQTEIESLGVPWHWDSTRALGIGWTSENAWSRHARRKRRREGEPLPQPTYPDALLGFSVSVRMKDVSNTEVLVHWMKGDDQAMFESFCGMLKRRVGESLTRGIFEEEPGIYITVDSLRCGESNLTLANRYDT